MQTKPRWTRLLNSSLYVPQREIKAAITDPSTGVRVPLRRVLRGFGSLRGSTDSIGHLQSPVALLGRGYRENTNHTARVLANHTARLAPSIRRLRRHRECFPDSAIVAYSPRSRVWRGTISRAPGRSAVEPHRSGNHIISMLVHSSRSYSTAVVRISS